MSSSSSSSIDRTALGYAVGNVSSSVALVLINKWVFSGGFRYPMTLTFFHFVFTDLFYRALEAGGMFTRKTMPFADSFRMAAAGVGSIGFMNISLHLNSVGFYQITKLAIVPATLAAQSLLFGVSTSTKIKLSLSILLLGLGLATVTDVQLNAPGFVIGLLAVLTTTIFQLWQGSKQKEYELSGVQLQAAVSAWQAAQSLAGALAMENLCVARLPWEETTRECNTAYAYIADFEAHRQTLCFVAATCVIALCVNGCSFGLIGRTSAITFQVVGHTKTCLVLTGGFILWPVDDVQQMIDNAIGVGVAFIGCVLYGHIKMAEGAEKLDLFDRCCPASVVVLLSPHKYKQVDGADTELGAMSSTDTVDEVSDAPVAEARK
jgi:solute carrier family 35 protein E3